MGHDGARSALHQGDLSEKRAHTVDGILSTAMVIVTEEGMAALSMSTLAARAGVSRQTLYTYFPDVEAVLTGMARMGEASTLELADRMRAEEDARAALGSFVSAAVKSARMGHPSLIAITAALPAELEEATADQRPPDQPEQAVDGHQNGCQRRCNDDADVVGHGDQASQDAYIGDDPTQVPALQDDKRKDQPGDGHKEKPGGFRRRARWRKDRLCRSHDLGLLCLCSRRCVLIAEGQRRRHRLRAR